MDGDDGYRMISCMRGGGDLFVQAVFEHGGDPWDCEHHKVRIKICSIKEKSSI